MAALINKHAPNCMRGCGKPIDADSEVFCGPCQEVVNGRIKTTLDRLGISWTEADFKNS